MRTIYIQASSLESLAIKVETRLNDGYSPDDIISVSHTYASDLFGYEYSAFIVLKS